VEQRCQKLDGNTPPEIDLQQQQKSSIKSKQTKKNRRGSKWNCSRLSKFIVRSRLLKKQTNKRLDSNKN